MKRSNENDQEENKVNELITFPVQFEPGQIKDNCPIHIDNSSKLSKEGIFRKALNYHSQGHILKAAKFYQYFIDQGFIDGSVYSNYASILTQFGKLKEAEILIRKSIYLNPNDINSLINLGNILVDKGNLKEAKLLIERVINIDPNSATAYIILGKIFMNLGDFKEAEISNIKAISLDSNLIESRLNLEVIARKAVPEWHIPMMNDYKRNNAYLKAIKRAIKNNQKVLEIGTGSGLLSMMAIDAGAKQVVTCETSEIIADAAKKIISKNGFSDKIKVINKKSTDLIVGKDIDQKADLIISEILSSEFVGEGVQLTLIDANKRLIKENGRIIPESGEIKVALLEGSQEINNELFVQTVNGYNLSEFNNIMKKKIDIHYLGRKVKPSFLCESIGLFHFDLYSRELTHKQEKTIEIKANKTGICLGLITWLRLNLYEDIYFENKPNEISTSGWVNPIYKLNQPMQIKKGQVLKLRATLLEDNVWYEIII